MYHIETAVVAIALIITALIVHAGRVERVGTLAVLLTFGHASVANRLEEAEHSRQQEQGVTPAPYHVRCYKKLSRYYYSKELCRTIYFIALGARSALVGVGLFLLYSPWRKLYRKYQPLERKG